MPVALLISLFLILPLSAQEEWPARFQVAQPSLKNLPGKEGTFVWQTPHLILVSELSLPPQRLRDFAAAIESVPQLFQKLPIPLWAPPKKEKPVIRICKDETSFVARGGPLGAAGYYNARQAIILVRGDLLLNPPQDKATNLKISPEGDLLVHELCHLAMHHFGTLPPWLSEGLAEYFASCHLGKGRYDFADSQRLIPLHIRKFYPRDQFPVLTLPPFSQIASLSSSEWIKVNKTALPEDRYRTYASALLLAHYYLEGGAKRRGELSDFLQQKLTDKRHPPKNLLTPVPPDLERQVVAFWKQKGLRLAFNDKPSQP